MPLEKTAKCSERVHTEKDLIYSDNFAHACQTPLTITVEQIKVSQSFLLSCCINAPLHPRRLIFILLLEGKAAGLRTSSESSQNPLESVGAVCLNKLHSLELPLTWW